MVVFRDDCTTVQERTDGESVVSATVVSVDPPIIQDTSSAIPLDQFPTEVEIGDLCYFLLDCSTRPHSCSQVTHIPPELGPVAQLQLSLYRQYEAAQ